MKRVLVVGDTMIDHYVHGNVNRLNPESPHTVILDAKTERRVLGGAANVAANLASVLSPDVKVDYLGVVDEEVLDMLTDVGVAASSEFNEPILVKKRFIFNNNYLLRVDEGIKYNFDHCDNKDQMINFVKTKSETIKWDLILVSDYKKGTLTYDFVDTLLEIAEKQECVVIIDLKTERIYPDGGNKNLIIKSNEREWAENGSIFPHGRSLLLASFVTKGKDGCDVYLPGNDYWKPKISIEAKKRDVVDVVGAGDSFLVGMGVSYLENGLDYFKMAEFGMKYAEAKIEHFGTYVLKKEDVK